MRIILFVLMLGLAAPAYALSCLRPDAVSLFEQARDSADNFYILKGRITAAGPIALPERSQTKSNFATSTVRVEGLGLNDERFSSPVARDITLQLSCLSVWCAGPPSEDEMIMAIKVSNKELLLEIGPCGGNVVAWDQDAEDRLLTCHRTGNCQRKDGF